MLQIIGFAIAAIIAAVFGRAATRPNSFRFERTTNVKASPATIVRHIEDFNAWRAWSPYEKLDPNMKRTQTGAPKGKGSIYEWSGNKKAGAGRMEILESSPSQVRIKLDFSKPFEAHNVTTFILQPAGDSTNVTWRMEGPSPFMMKLMGVFVGMDKLLGKDFDTGLGNLKRVAESA
jgi:hypothetical protein